MKSNFIMSVANVKQLPPQMFPEIAFAGRSNVGKSSMMNAVLGRKKLVKTGKIPGKTRLLNFFNVNDRLVFVDLPGYGYAAVSKTERAGWARLLDSYFRKRQTLTLCFILVDIRRTIESEEMELLELLAEYNISSCIVLTKADKVSQNQLLNRKTKIAKDIDAEVEKLIHFSVITGEGKKEIIKKISESTGVELV
ncbi:MAG: ribosome biogenesis GTP-binding protein YihA/YsxC [Deferribacteraceae bacterium]|jgi:GTP-binding protein|nr:ribosome biogenesis GTP-binding protein YihA/YsxC [Deferribacteraceae bacterium]